MKRSGVRALLMGGQACVFYGAAEFSRDLDLLILADAANLDRLRTALADLQAEPIAVPARRRSTFRKGTPFTSAVIVTTWTGFGST